MQNAHDAELLTQKAENKALKDEIQHHIEQNALLREYNEWRDEEGNWKQKQIEILKAQVELYKQMIPKPDIIDSASKR